MKKISYWIVIVAFIGACTSKKDNQIITDRPHDPWVFRSVLDTLPRMITLALHEDAWAAYSTDHCSMYKLWKGSVNLTGAVYNTHHGPQPYSTGDAYIVEHNTYPWSVQIGEKIEEIKPQYAGHQILNGQVSLLYDMNVNGSRVEVVEHIEVVETELDQLRFERKFSVNGLPEGANLLLDFEINSVVGQDAIYSNQEVTINKVQEKKNGQIVSVNILGKIKLKEGENILNVTLLKKPQIHAARPENEISADVLKPLGERLIDQSDCKTCHNTTVKTIGPSYLEIAKAYKTTSENIATLSNKVIKGGTGVWGEQVMSAHPDLSGSDANGMIKYILSLDDDNEEVEDQGPMAFIPPLQDIISSEVKPGLVSRVFVYNTMSGSLNTIPRNRKPDYEGIFPNVFLGNSDFGKLMENFYIDFDGFIYIPEDGEYKFRLTSDDGSRLYINNQMIIDHDGYHGADTKDGRVRLEKGYYPILVEYFQGLGGKTLYLNWKTPSTSSYVAVQMKNLSHLKSAENSLQKKGLPFGSNTKIPGDAFPLEGVHPSYDLTQARPNDFLPKVGGMDFMADGRLVISTWDAEGSVYILDGVENGDAGKITVKKIASGLAEPLGLKIVEGDIYVLQKQELTQLIDKDGDEIIDVYKTVCNAWTVSTNFHEFAFGLANKGDDLYAALAIQILPGGASGVNQPKDRGKVIKINRHTGEHEFVAHGLRTPNGVGIGVDGELFIADNQGDWLPSSKILHVKEGDFFGSRAIDFIGTENLNVKQPVVWLPQDEIGNSPTQPTYINDGPYAGQMIHSEVTNGGVKRVFVEKINGNYQGAVFRFTQGLESGINRIVWGPDGALYAGGVGSTGNWVHSGKLWYGLQRLKYNDKSTFEMLSVKAKSNGLEIEFTEPLKEGDGSSASDYEIAQWYYQPTAQYGGPKMDERVLSIRSVNVSNDRKKVFLEIEGIKGRHVQYIHLNKHFISELGHQLWSTEAWYTMNSIPNNTPGFSNPVAKVADNTLTEAEKSAGWKLLFDGSTTNGWHRYRGEGVGSAWKVKNGSLILDNSQKNANGGIIDGGDIVTDQEYEHFELSLEWKMSPCGNSGIMFYVLEDEKYDAPYHTGPEMQVLDNACHPDAQIVTHRAGDLYDMISCNIETVKPAGQWNHVIVKIINGEAEFWLNGIRVVEFTMWDETWKDMIANSKFRQWEGFGKYKKGKIVLQDHTDEVAFKNLKIREIKVDAL